MVCQIEPEGVLNQPTWHAHQTYMEKKMTVADSRGDAISGASGKSLESFETGLAQFQCYLNDPVASLDEALAESPKFAMAHGLRGYLHGLAMEAVAQSEVKAAIDGMAAATLNDRERQHKSALEAFFAADWHVAARRLDDIIAEYPRDAVAVQVLHLLDFYRGDSRNLRDRISRVLPEWNAGLPGYHAVLGMHSFGLEECNQFDLAEEAGRQAVAMNAKDAWAIHAVAHVLEMRGEAENGARWLRQRTGDWSVENFFSVHNWWHLTLFELDQGRVDEVLRLYDDKVQADGSTVVLDMIDASALLWRLHLRGIDVGDRWQELADRWAPLAEDGFYAFNDFHGVMAFIGAGRIDDVARVIAAQTARAADGDYNGVVTRDVGLPLCQALADFAGGRYGEATDGLRGVRGIAQRFGGSNAQRDLLDLTLLEAASRDGQWALVKSLSGERTTMKPASPIGWAYRQRSTAGLDVKAVA